MRDIKFRAFDTLTNKMICVGFSVIGETTVFGLIDQYVGENMCGKGSLDRYNDIKITQFTGLKDKNGREIYEGDFVKNINEKSKLFNQVSPVHWLEHLTGFSPFNLMVFEKNCPYVVIGNIFETPELLK